MPWLNKCLDAIDVTNIGCQNSLKQAVENSAIRLEAMEKESEKKTEEIGDTMNGWKGKIEKEKSDSSTGKAENRSRAQKEKQIDEYVLLKQERVYLSCFNSTN